MKFRVQPARLGAAISAVIVCLAMATACGGGDNKSSDGAQASGANADIRAMFPQSILDAGVLKVGLGAPSPPNAMLDSSGKVDEGIDYDILSAVGKLAGLNVEFQPLAFSAIIPSLQAGRSDVTGALVPSPDRTKVADFVVWDKVPWGLLVPKGNPKGITDSGDLCGLTIAAAQGSFTKYLTDARQKDTCDPAGTKIDYREYATQDAAILAVKSGQADVFPQGNSVTAYIAKTTDGGSAFDNVPDYKGMDGTVFFAEGFGILKTDQELVKAVQAAIQELVDNGDYAKFLDKYGLGIEAIKHITINEHDPSDIQQ